MSRFIFATAIIWILGGFGTWLIGNVGAHCPTRRACETNHIGASGLIFGWLAFLIVFGFFTRKVWEIVVGVVVLFIYGSVLLGVLPGTLGVSWQGHLCGAVAGVDRRLSAVRAGAQGPRSAASAARAAAVPDAVSVANSAPVGIFDSGVGGLTVARAIIDQLPDEDIIYVGDTGNGPYGPLTIPEIRAHALAIGDDLVAARRQGAGDRVQHARRRPACATPASATRRCPSSR